MLSTNTVLLTALAYVAFLFVLAFVSETGANRGHYRVLRSPLVYTLSISVYCTSWTFYGAVGSAARSGLEFITIYLGPTLVFIGAWYLLRKLVRIGKVHHITSIADLISSRYGKNTTLAALVTAIAVIGTTPYIALQLKAVTTSFEVVSNATDAALLGASTPHSPAATGFWVAVAMAAFTILFGTRNVDANEHHPGVVAAIAFEALVKLFALLAVGLFVVLSIAGGVDAVFELPAAQRLVETQEGFGSRWLSLTILSAIAIVCLPRQFQVTVVENTDEQQLRTASWLFPLYLLLISVAILPIAIVGLSVLPAGSNPDMFVLTLPMSQGQDALALLAFIGGFSSATSMVIVASIALSTMVSNHIVVPVALRLPWVSLDASGDIRNLLLVSRRISIAVILMLGFIYFRLGAQSDALASMGLIAFVAVAQFLPCIIGGLYWRNATAKGAIAGLGTGFVLWVYTLLVPSLAGSAPLLHAFVEYGPSGIELLRPERLFGYPSEDPLVHALAWSLGMNTLVYVLISILSRPSLLENVQSALFVDVFRNTGMDESSVIHRSARVDDLYVLAQRILGPDEAYRLFNDFARGQGIIDDLPVPDASFIAFLERRFAGSIGGASARVMVSQVATGETISLNEAIKLVDETQQVIEYSHQLEQKSAELENTARQLQIANAQLRELDTQKDDFLSQVSHEVRTPMTSIRSFAELLIEDKNLGPEQTNRFLGIIHEESLRLTRLLDEILELSRLERRQIEITSTETDAECALDGALETCRILATQADIEVREGTRAPHAPVLADGDRLRQVFINLLSNAIKYNSNATPFVTVTSEIDRRNYRVRVQDNGPGIDLLDRARIFDKFSRGRGNGARGQGGGGIGLGLAISREIVHNFGGELELIGSQAPGACFQVTLPLHSPVGT